MSHTLNIYTEHRPSIETVREIVSRLADFELRETEIDPPSCCQEASRPNHIDASPWLPPQVARPPAWGC